jgi:hypothetical protein
VTPAAKKATAKRASTRAARGRQSSRRRPRKDTTKLVGRFALDFAALRGVQLERAGVKEPIAAPAAALAVEQNPALLRLQALEERDAAPGAAVPVTMPVNAAIAN